MNGVAWALVAAVAFGVTQTINRKANQLTSAYRTAFGLLVWVEVVLVGRAVVTGELALLARAPLPAVVIFAVTALLHFGTGWTLVALSQQRIGLARTGTLVAAAPLVGSLLATAFLGEPLDLITFSGVVAATFGVALISLSGVSDTRRLVWTRPWLALTVAVIWGTTPLLIRWGLTYFDKPVLGLTVGLAVALAIHGSALARVGAWKGDPTPTPAVRWIVAGGVTGALAISAQWISYDLTTVAVAITVQQLAALVVLVLAPLMFPGPSERLNPLLGAGTVLLLAGTAAVVLIA